jgi:hypothetical protein
MRDYDIIELEMLVVRFTNNSRVTTNKSGELLQLVVMLTTSVSTSPPGSDIKIKVMFTI